MGEMSPLTTGKPLGLAATVTRAIPRCSCWPLWCHDGLSLPHPSEPSPPPMLKVCAVTSSCLLGEHRPPTVWVAAGPCLICPKQPGHREVTFLG